MTFSLVARCAKTGMFGIAISSSSPAVAARCAYVRAGVGAVGTQNITDPRLGPRLLDLMAAGQSAQAAVAELRAGESDIEYRQLLAIDAAGRTAGFSGKRTLGTFAIAEGANVAAAGNLLANDGVPAAMIAAFGAATGHLGDRLVAAMQAAVAAGGEAGPVRSAGMLIVDQAPWPVTDLRVDFHEQPIDELGALWQLWRPQAEDYVKRALKPQLSPAFGVPGDP